MFLIDTSVWIHLLGKNKKYKITEEQLLSVVLCPPIVQEIFQGIRDDFTHKKIMENLMALPQVGTPVLLQDYLKASEIYRIGRQKGYTIRSSVDCLIAAIAIREDVPIWHEDRDFDRISKFTELKTAGPM